MLRSVQLRINFFNFLILITLLRAVLLLLLVAEGYSIFSDDGVTRLLLAQEWSEKPWFSSQIPWQPLQFYLIGSLSWLTSLSVYTIGLAVNFLLALSLPWMFSLILPQEMQEAKRRMAVLVVALWPWALWPGISGLSEPLMWNLGLCSWFAFLKERRGLFVFSSTLLMMTRIEAWIFVAIICFFQISKEWKRGNCSQAFWFALVLSAWPLIWQSRQIFYDQTWLSFSMREKDSIEIYSASFFLKILMFPLVAFFAAPFWSLLLVGKKALKLTYPKAPLVLFTLTYWLASIVVALATAVPQRNLVLPLLLWFPLLVNRANKLVIFLVLLGQLWTLSHPRFLLRDDIQTEKNYIVSSIKEINSQEHKNHKIMVQLQPDPYAYLPRYLVLKGIPKDQVFVDHQPQRWDTRPYSQRIKYIMYEESALCDEPLVNYWRSWKPDQSILEDKSIERIRNILEKNQISIIISAQNTTWPNEYHYKPYAYLRDHIIWLKNYEKKPQTYVFANSTNRSLSHREIVLEALKSKSLSKDVFKVFIRMVGL